MNNHSYRENEMTGRKRIHEQENDYNNHQMMTVEMNEGNSVFNFDRSPKRRMLNYDYPHQPEAENSCHVDEVNIEMMTEDDDHSSSKNEIFPLFQSSSRPHHPQNNDSNANFQPIGTVTSCWHCKNVRSSVACQLCTRNVCESSCLKYCESCNCVCCTTCIMIDYSFRYERILCMDCYYQRK
jgi:hypothetical protein